MADTGKIQNNRISKPSFAIEVIGPRRCPLGAEASLDGPPRSHTVLCSTYHVITVCPLVVWPEVVLCCWHSAGRPQACGDNCWSKCHSAFWAIQKRGAGQLPKVTAHPQVPPLLWYTLTMAIERASSGTFECCCVFHSICYSLYLFGYFQNINMALNGVY